MAQALPFLPGYNQDVKPKSQFHKSHLFDVQNGIRVDTVKATDIADMYSFPVNGEATLALTTKPQDFANNAGAKYTTVNAALNQTSSLPAWVAFDRKVLRFYAYFTEAVFSSPMEATRVRKCVLYYYLEDDSVHIAEPKVENSGIPQGVFVKRHRIPKANNEMINLNDLQIGNVIPVYGRNFKLYDCDDFTRAFFQTQGQPLGAAEELPVDAFTKKHTIEQTTFKKLMHPMKEFQEARAGKQMGINIKATQKFLKNDGNVLRFYTVWRDDKVLGEPRPFVLHYFLADDTLEVMEVKQANSGRDPFQTMLARGKCPKDYTVTAPDLTRIGAGENQKNPQNEYYTEMDLKIGGTVNVYGRELNIMACDDFTKRFYKRNYNMTDEDFPVLNEVQSNMLMVSEPMRPPEYNGFGTEEDSLGSYLYLNPRIPKCDMKQLMENSRVKLHYLAKMVNSAPEDKNRRFILTYHMDNDTVGVFEKFERNSGHTAGKFSERARRKNPETGEFYSTKDFYVGNQLKLVCFNFEIIEADVYTTNYMAANPTHFTLNDGGETAF